MKVILFDDNAYVKQVITEVYGDIEQGKDWVTWKNGGMRGIKYNFTVVDDDVVVGEKLVEGDRVDGIITKNLKIVNKNVRESCYKGFTSTVTGWEYETEEHDQKNFTRRMLTLLMDTNKTEVKWKTADGVVRTHTRDEFLDVCRELDDFLSSQVNKGWLIKRDLRNATTIKEVESISLEVE